MSDKINTYPVANCRVCGSPGTSKYSDLKDLYFGDTSGWNMDVCTNKNCGLMWLNPMPTKEDIGKAYAFYYTHSSNEKTAKDFSLIRKGYLALKYGYFPEKGAWLKFFGLFAYLIPLLKNKLDFTVLYTKYQPKGKMLDFGCGNGDLLNNLKSLGWDTYGLDFDPKAVECCKRIGLNAAVGDIKSQNYPDGFFDVVTINHVIEHVHEPDLLIADAMKILKKGGKLIVATPNTNNWQFGLFGKSWFQLDPPRHLCLFNAKNLEKLVEDQGLKVSECFSSVRMDAWSTIVARGAIRKGSFKIGIDKKKISDLIIGMLHQYYSGILHIFDKQKGGEIILIATKK